MTNWLKEFCFERSGSKRSEQSNLVLYNYKFEPASSHVPNLYAAAAMDFPIDGVYGTEYEYLGLYWPQHCYPCDYLWAGILTVELVLFGVLFRKRRSKDQHSRKTA